MRAPRTKKPTRPSPPGTAIAAQASGIAPIVGPPTAAAASLGRGGGDQLTGGPERRRAQQGLPGVHVVLSLRPRGEGDLPDAQAVLAKLG